MNHRKLTLNSRYAFMVARLFLSRFKNKKLDLTKFSIDIDPVAKVALDVSKALDADCLEHRCFDRSFKWVLVAPLHDDILPFYKALLFCDDTYQKIFRAYHCRSYPGNGQARAAILKSQKRTISKAIRSSVDSMVTL